VNHEAAVARVARDQPVLACKRFEHALGFRPAQFDAKLRRDDFGKQWGTDPADDQARVGEAPKQRVFDARQEETVEERRRHFPVQLPAGQARSAEFFDDIRGQPDDEGIAARDG